MNDHRDALPEFYDPASDQLHALAHCLDALGEASLGMDMGDMANAKSVIVRAMSRIAGQMGGE